MTLTMQSRHLLCACVMLCLFCAASDGADAAAPPKGLPADLALLTTLPPVGKVTDWLTPADPSAFPIRPADGSLSLQSPPGFTWPDVDPAAGYEVRLILPDSTIIERMAAQNILLLDEVLPPGRYGWQVRIRGDGRRGWSSLRQFEIAPMATPFPVPDSATLWRRAVDTPHPRILPDAAEWQQHRADLLAGQRAVLFARVQNAAAGAMGKIYVPDPVEPVTGPVDELHPGWAPQTGEGAYRAELEALERSALIGQVTQDPAILADARARLLNAAGWSPHGAVAFHVNDKLAKDYAWALALAFDLLYDTLSPAERTAVGAAVASSVTPPYKSFLDNPPARKYTLQASPLNSHGYQHLANIAAVSVIFAGHLAQARSWFDTAVPLLLAMPHPWGGDDGGSGNGGNYAFYYLQGLMPRWDVLHHGIGINPADQAWARNFPLYATYFHGPRMPFVGGDGAGHGDARLTGTVMRNLYARTGSRLALWYSRLMPFSFPVPPIMELTAPPAPTVPTVGPDLAELPDAAVFPSIGWAALHSDLQSRQKASIYFRSGPFGSNGHNDADQNSFVIHLDGKRLAVDSGYYDSYDSPHMMAWARHTRAHNAITFDGGMGQAAKRLDTYGRITGFSDDGRLASVTGDATNAYDGKLTDAVRTLALLRPDILLVYDRLASRQARQFEWNLHSLGEMVSYAQNALGISYRDTSLCVEMLAPPGLTMTKNDRFGDPDTPPGNPDLPRQWHARFATPSKMAQIEFLAVLRLRCTARPVSEVVARPGGGFELTIGNNRVGIGAQGAELNPRNARH